MKKPPSFYLKFRAFFSATNPRETYQDYLEQLNQRDWRNLIAAAASHDDPFAQEVISPPPGVDRLTYLTRLLDEASPKVCELVGRALAQHIRALTTSEPRETDTLSRLFSMAQAVRLGMPVTLLEDLCQNKRLSPQIRLDAAFALSELRPECLNPRRLDLTQSAAYFAAIVAASRAVDVGWLDAIFSADLPRPHQLLVLRSPLRATLKLYWRRFGDDRFAGLLVLCLRLPWCARLMSQLFASEPELAAQRAIFSTVQAQEGKRREQITTEALAQLREATLRAKEDLWSDVTEEELGAVLGWRRPRSLQSLGRIAELHPLEDAS